MRAAFRVRLRYILVGVMVVAIFIAAKLYFVQIVHGEEYALKADRQYLASSGSLFNRGTIYFTRKDGTELSAASLATGYLLAVNPKLIENAEATYEVLAPRVGEYVDRAAFLKAARSPDAVYVEVAHRLPEAVGEAIADENVPGISIIRERWRIYPAGSLAPQTIGTVARTATDDVLRGRTGLERYYDTTLSRGDDGLYRNFFADLFANLSNALAAADEAREGNLVTTLEPELQTRLTNVLGKVQEKYSSKETGGIIMDPKTGAILAIASFPTYNANEFSKEPIAYLTNPLVSHVYEFGSIMKPLTMAAAFDAGVVTPESTYRDQGCITLDTSTICNFDLKARGVTSMQDILSQSLNLGAAHLASKLGNEQVRSYFTKLGFGEKTGVDLPAETSGLIENLSSPRQIEYATAAFGQGIAITPFEMLRAIGALANGGKTVKPHLVSGVKLDTGVTKEISWEGGTQVFSPEVVRQVSEMLTHVVDHDLSKGVYALPTLSVAAKTGTAQLVAPGGYYDDRYFHSFFGYFPSYDPRFIILLYTNDPKGVTYASETLTATFMDLAHFLAEYYELPPDRTGIPS